MPTFRITAPDGTKYDVTGPEGATEEQALAQVQAQHAQKPSKVDRGFMGGLVDSTAGLVRGAGSIGATLLAPGDALADAVLGKGAKSRNQMRREGMDLGLREMGADTDSMAFGGGKLTSEIGGTAGIGGALAKGAQALKAAPEVVNALGSAGFRTGAAPTNLIGRAKDIATRVGAGATVGGASAGAVNPDDALTGAVIGGALPPAIKVAGMAGRAAGKALTGGDIAPEVVKLADRAKDLGIDIPADRITNSKPLNAVAAGLNYVPFSGRAAVETRMQDQLNEALSKTFGQNSTNVTQALRKAQTTLGSEFDRVLKGNSVNFDQQLLTDVADVGNKANRTLGADALRPIDAQIKEIMTKGAGGAIDGQAAYNIKRELDTIGRGSGTEANAARELKKALMAALDRSLGPKEAAAFAETRKQYGNMLSLENLAQNGAEGDISIARLANMKNINNGDLQELADIAAQFLKPREGQHGAAQRAFAGLGVGSLAGPAALGGTVALGRATNHLLDSRLARSAVLGRAPVGNLIGSTALRPLPVLAADERTQ